MQSISKYPVLLLFSLLCTHSYAQHDFHQSISETDSLNNEVIGFLESLKQNYISQSSFRTAGEENYQMLDTVFTYEFVTANDSVLIKKESPEYDDNLYYSSYTHYIKDDTWHPISKVSYKINKHGHYDFYLHQNWDATINSLRNNMMSDFYYNENGQDTLKILSLWDTEQDKWNYDVKVKSTYNNDGQRVSYRHFNYDQNLQQWIPQFGNDDIYENNLLKEVHNFSNNGAGELQPSTYITYSYDGHNNIIADSTFSYQSSTQSYDFHSSHGSKLEYENDLIKVRYDSLVTSNGNVSSKYKVYYNYHSNKEIFSKTDSVYRWNPELGTSEWRFYHYSEYDEEGHRTKAIYENAKYIMQYTEAGVQKSYESYYWDKNLEYWVGQKKYENEYNSDNKRLLQKIYRPWAENETDWSYPQHIAHYNYKSVGINQKEIAVCGDLTIPRDTIYQTPDSLELVIYQTKDVVSTPEITLNEEILTAPEYSGALYKWIDCNTGSILSSDSNKYYLTTSGSYKVETELYNCTIESACIDATVITSIASDQLPEVMVYPNPFTGLLRFDNRSYKYNEILVINAEGKLLYSAPLDPGNGTVDLNFLKNGMYIIKLTGNENTYSKKIIKE